MNSTVDDAVFCTDPKGELQSTVHESQRERGGQRGEGEETPRLSKPPLSQTHRKGCCYDEREYMHM